MNLPALKSGTVLTISEDKKWSLTIDGNPIVTSSDQLPVKRDLAITLANNGYGDIIGTEPNQKVIPSDDALKDASVIFIQLVNDKIIKR